jgi:2-isopropylmalate synthase
MSSRWLCGVEPKDDDFFRRMEKESTGRAVLAAFGMTRGRGKKAEEDRSLAALASCWTPVVAVVGKTWDLHVKKVLRVDRDENLRMIADSVAFLRERGNGSSTTPNISSTRTLPTPSTP